MTCALELGFTFAWNGDNHNGLNNRKLTHSSENDLAVCRKRDMSELVITDSLRDANKVKYFNSTKQMITCTKMITSTNGVDSPMHQLQNWTTRTIKICVGDDTTSIKQLLDDSLLDSNLSHTVRVYSDEDGFIHVLPELIFIGKGVLMSKERFKKVKQSLFKQLENTIVVFLEIKDLIVIKKLENMFDNDYMACMIPNLKSPAVVTSIQSELGRAVLQSYSKKQKEICQFIILSLANFNLSPQPIAPKHSLSTPDTVI